MVINQRLQAGIAITLLEPDPLAWNNILSFFPRIFLQGLVVITVGAEPQRNPVPLAIRVRKRDWHTWEFSIRWGATDEVHQRSAANYTPRPVSRQASLSWLGECYGDISTVTAILAVMLKLSDTVPFETF